MLAHDWEVRKEASGMAGSESLHTVMGTYSLSFDLLALFPSVSPSFWGFMIGPSEPDLVKRVSPSLQLQLRVYGQIINCSRADKVISGTSQERQINMKKCPTSL